MEQAPGPSGSPQVPHGPLAGLAEADLAETANTESWVASLLLRHLGQEAFSSPYTRASKRFSQFLQMYSKMGMVCGSRDSEVKNKPKLLTRSTVPTRFPCLAPIARVKRRDCELSTQAQRIKAPSPAGAFSLLAWKQVYHIVKFTLSR